MTALHRPLQVSQLRLQPLQLWCKALTFQWRRHLPQVPKLRWAECAACQARMEAEDLPDEAALQSWFIRRVLNTKNLCCTRSNKHGLVILLRPTVSAYVQMTAKPLRFWLRLCMA